MGGLRRILAASLGWWVFSSSAAHAHNPDDSWTVVRVVGATLEVEVEMATEAAMALLGVPMGTQPGPADRNELIAPLAAAAGKIYRFTIADAALELREAVAEPREEDGYVFHLVYARPAGATRSLRCEARFLEKVTPVHRTAITLVDAKGAVLGGEQLNVDRTAVVLELPDD